MPYFRHSVSFRSIFQMDGFNFKDRYNVDDLRLVVKVLRSENGCPWDKVQTHETLKKDFLEEVYEVIEAIDANSVPMLREELGDVLLQVVFHADIEEDAGTFNLDDVADEVCKKLIERHPHVFGELSLETPEEVLKSWDSIKKEKKQQSFTDTLNAVPKVFPALMRAQKLGKRASRAGMDFTDANGAFESLRSEVSEAEAAVISGDTQAIAEELGDILFSCVNVARLSGLDAEELLTASSNKFINRFSAVEDMVRQDGKEMTSLSIDELDSYWKRAK